MTKVPYTFTVIARKVSNPSQSFSTIPFYKRWGLTGRAGMVFRGLVLNGVTMSSLFVLNGVSLHDLMASQDKRKLSDSIKL